MKHIKNTLYILTPETYLCLQNENILVKVGGEEKVRVPALGLEAVYCFGNVTVSTPLIAFCGERGISLAFSPNTADFTAGYRGRCMEMSFCGGCSIRQWRIRCAELGSRKTSCSESSRRVKPFCSECGAST